MPLDDRQRAAALDILRTAHGEVSSADRALVSQLLAERADPGASDVPAQVRETVQIWRDGRGVPHIQAANTRDLFFAHGYVQAQDRFYEMDVRRHVVAGRLSEHHEVVLVTNGPVAGAHVVTYA